MASLYFLGDRASGGLSRLQAPHDNHYIPYVLWCPRNVLASTLFVTCGLS